MTADEIIATAPNCSRLWAEALVAAMQRASITTPDRAAMFLAQCAHESGGFARFVENLNYGAEGLVATWPGRFRSVEFAQLYHRRPEAIANRVYSDRMGNGDEASGDGWRFRGRSPLMLTGRANYRRASAAIAWPLETQPDDAAEPTHGADVAAWYWTDRALNDYADRGDFESVTRRINGGMIGAEDRRRWLGRFRATQSQGVTK